jgi:predicted esterase
MTTTPPPHEHHLAVTRTARYVTLGQTGVADVWLVLHGYGQLAHRFIRSFAPFADGRLIVAPEALNRFYVDAEHRKVGATWMTREDRLTDISDYVGYLDAVAGAVLPPGGAARVTAFGFSQGSATACRWATRGRTRVHRLVCWAGEIPPDLDLPEVADRLRACEMTLAAGTEDRYITPKVVEQMAARLQQHDVGHRVFTFDGGHEIPETALRALIELLSSR